MYIIIRAIDLYCLIVIASAILSWFPGASDNPIGRGLRALTDPIYSVIHKVIPPSATGGIDLSPIVVLVVLSFIRNSLARGF